MSDDVDLDAASHAAAAYLQAEKLKMAADGFLGWMSAVAVCAIIACAVVAFAAIAHHTDRALAMAGIAVGVILLWSFAYLAVKLAKAYAADLMNRTV